MGIVESVNVKILDFKNGVITIDFLSDEISIDCDDEIFEIGKNYIVNLYYDNCGYHLIEYVNN